MEIAVWVVATLFYLAFRVWYDGLGRPLTPQEIEHFLQIIREHADPGLDTRDIATLRRFMEEDDGREFIMANLIEFNDSPVTHPDTGKEMSAPALLAQYTKPFMGRILRQAGHPVIAGRGVGGYLDAWNTPPDPGWHMIGLVRYRSRRDAMSSSLADPAFAAIHKYKIAAIRQTLAFPAKTQVALYASPRVTVALVLALCAALLQLALR